jgi:hypothetical protein
VTVFRAGGQEPDNALPAGARGSHRPRRAPHLVYPPEELLTSQCEGALWHARYPSALFTLCGREAVGSGDGEPTCGVCVTTAVRFDEIDGSVPAHWGWPA